MRRTNQRNAKQNKKEIRQNFLLRIENNLIKLKSAVKKLGPKDRIKAIVELSKLVLLILRASELSTPIDNKLQLVTINLGSGIK